MSCWRLLQLDDASNSHVPQLLVKPAFASNAYTVFLTDLSNVWSEDLDLGGIVRRASEQKSPIEVSKHDTWQLAILLENVARSLTHADDTVCRITRDDAEGVILHTSTRLPEPLDSLHWKFKLKKQAAITLKNELILPLLVSAHIQHERMNSLTSIIQDKDRAITRLVDQYESSHLDLASAFPSINGLKPGRRIVKREQAARHVPALRDFEEDKWKRETSQLQNGQVCELGLFQEALSECNPDVPTHMRLNHLGDSWWQSINSALQVSGIFSRPKGRVVSPAKPTGVGEEETETETEDEFETHENFKSRGIAQRPDPPPANSKVPDEVKDATTEDENDDSDDDDLDAAPRSQSHSQSAYTKTPLKKLPSRTKSPEPKPSMSPSPSPAKPKPSTTPKGKGFKVGGIKRKAPAEETLPDVTVDQTLELPVSDTQATQKPLKRGFMIGGKRKVTSESREPSRAPGVSPSEAEPSVPRPGPILDKDAPPRPASRVEKKAATPEEEEREETAEDRAERRRAELKRKNEELAKKQAQKKKKRF